MHPAGHSEPRGRCTPGIEARACAVPNTAWWPRGLLPPAISAELRVPNHHSYNLLGVPLWGGQVSMPVSRSVSITLSSVLLTSLQTAQAAFRGRLAIPPGNLGTENTSLASESLRRVRAQARLGPPVKLTA